MQLIKRIILCVVALVAVCVAQGQGRGLSSFAGRWWLAMLEEASLPMNLTFVENDTAVIPQLYSPMQSHQPIPISKWTYKNDSLTIQAKSIGLKLSLLWNRNDSTFNGAFRQGLLKAQMHFLPSKELFKLNRPQEPHPPYPYIEEEVSVDCGNGVIISGTLTRPGGNGKTPAVLLITGSGAQNRDEEIMGHKPFLVLADFLTKNGIAVLRYDDRGTARSTGNFSSATSLDLAEDAEQMFEWLRKQNGIDPKHVGLIGHSEGGLIGPMIAARNKNVAMVVLLAGPGYSGEEILMQQNRRIFELQGVEDSLISTRLACLKDLFEACRDTSSANQKLYRNIIEKHTQKLDKSQCDKIALHPRDSYSWWQQLAAPWMQTFLDIDPKEYLPMVKCPILALGGEKDSQVLARENLESIRELTHNKAEIHILPQLNHLFQHCDTGLSNEYMFIEETLSIEVLELIKKFIEKHS